MESRFMGFVFLVLAIPVFKTGTGIIKNDSGSFYSVYQLTAVCSPLAAMA